MDVFACITQEMNNWEIATALDRSETAIKAHVSDLLAKLGAVVCSGAILEARKQGPFPLGYQLPAQATHSHGGKGDAEGPRPYHHSARNGKPRRPPPWSGTESRHRRIQRK
jgi:hypothetical protein